MLLALSLALALFNGMGCGMLAELGKAGCFGLIHCDASGLALLPLGFGAVIAPVLNPIHHAQRKRESCHIGQQAAEHA